MTEIKIAYEPDISQILRKIIRDDVTPSMVSQDESTCQYEIGECLRVAECYEAEIATVEIKRLIKNGFHYLEF